MPDEEAIISEVRYLTGRHVRICGGHKIQDFIEELEFSLTGSKDAMESSETIEGYFSILECISVGMYGEKSLDEICAVEAILGYYEDDSYEERIGELVSEWAIRYGM